MDASLTQLDTDCKKVLTQLKEELKAIRTGKANPALIENLVVETYGGQTKLRLLELGSILSEGPMTLTISPYDPSVTQDIEKAILKSPLGISPSVQTGKIYVRIPPLSEEQRQKLAKLVGQKAEEKKGIVRNLRDEARKKVKTQLEEKTITEDDRFRLEKEIDTITHSTTEQLQVIREAKEKEIMEV